MAGASRGCAQEIRGPALAGPKDSPCGPSDTA